MSEHSRTPDLEDLLAHSGWVKALARSLVSDSAAADDVEQGAWLVALERPPRHGSNLRSWFASVVRSVAGQGWREEARRKRGSQKLESRALQEADAELHEGLLGSGSAQAPEALAERLDTFQNLARIVADLEEPYGSAIYLRYFEGLSVKEVASQQGISAANAQTRLRRGLEKLRVRMHGRFGGEWMNRCMVFAAPLPAASVSVPLIGAILMSTKTKVLAAAAVLLAIPLYTIFSDLGAGESLPDTSVSLSEAELAAEPPVVVDADPVPQRVIVPSASVGNEQEYASASMDPYAHKIRVIDAQTLKPVAGAEVLYFDRANPLDKEWSRLRFREHLATESLLERFGAHYQTDERGETALPPRASYAWIAARVPGKYAQVYLLEDPNDDPNLQVELLLRERIDIPVRVLDWQGQAVAGITVAYQDEYAPGHEQTIDRVVTDESGRGTLRNMQVRFADANRRNLHKIAVLIPLAQGAQQVFELDHPPTSEILFRLPETGSVVVSAFDHVGKPYRDGHPVLLHKGTVGDASKGEAVTEFATNHSEGTLAYIKDGRVTFPWVGLNTPLVAYASFHSGTVKTEVRHTGIIDPHVPLQLELHASAPGTNYDAVLIDENDQLLINARIDGDKELRYSNGLSTQAAYRNSTDEQGKMTLVHNMKHPTAFEATGDLGHSFVLLSHFDSGRGKARWGVVDWPVEPSKRRVDLGEVSIGKSLIAAGKVVDAQGKVMPFAQMYLDVPRPAEAYANPMQRKSNVMLSWSCDDQGDFEVRGELGHAPERLSLSIAPASSQEAHDLQPVEFELGQKDQTLVFAAKAAVQGRILLDANIPSELLKLSLNVEGAAADQPSFYFLDLEADNARFQLSGLPECSARMQLRAEGSGVVLATSELFSLQAGEVSTPADWAPLDLRGKLWPHTVEVRTADGEQPEEYSLNFPDLNRIAQVRSMTPFTFVTSEMQSLVQVDLQGYRLSDPILVGEKEVIQLETAIPVLIQLPDGLKLSESDDWKVEIRLDQPTPTGVRSWTPSRTVAYSAALDGFMLQVPKAGLWKLSMYRVVPKDDYIFGVYNRIRFESGHLYEIDVPAQSEEQRITLPISQEMVQKALSQD